MALRVVRNIEFLRELAARRPHLADRHVLTGLHIVFKNILILEILQTNRISSFSS